MQPILDFIKQLWQAFVESGLAEKGLDMLGRIITYDYLSRSVRLPIDVVPYKYKFRNKRAVLYTKEVLRWHELDTMTVQQTNGYSLI